jgi:hypothetical protein
MYKHTATSTIRTAGLQSFHYDLHFSSALADVLTLCMPTLQNAPRENPDCSIDPMEVELFRSYYSSLMYKVCCLGVVHS